MKKYIYTLVLLLLCIIGADSQKVGAYSVTVEKDGMYAEVVPDSFVNNAAPIFKKYVNKAMKYYNKYKDADVYTYVSEVPEEQRDFIPVAKQIQDSDEIIIRNPFYIYAPGPGEDTDKGEVSDYYFFAEKNGKKLCMFEIYIDPGSGEVSFLYNKMMDGRFAYDEKTTGETLFYWMDDIIYAETQDSTSVVWNKKYAGEVNKMMGGDGIDWEAEWEAAYQKFEKKSYSEKKDEIFSRLAGTKNEKLVKKVEKNLKQELKNEYVEPEEDEEESDGTSIYIMTGIGIMVIGVIGGIVSIIKRKKE